MNISSADFDIDRVHGSLIGCATGDALGTTLEFRKRGTFIPLKGIVGGGPFHLHPGEWTDDTSMMCCLAESLIRTKTCDLKDQMDLYILWWKNGVFSSNGKCFDIGLTVSAALQRFIDTGNPISGRTDPMNAGNGSLMRIAPIPIRYYDDFSEAVHYAGLSSTTTHGAEEAVDACRFFSGLIWGALHGETKEKLLDGIYSPINGFWDEKPLCKTVTDLISSEQYKKKLPHQIHADGYVMHTLEAVLWSFYHSDTFEEGALIAVNFGEDADTTGAVYGQLAGAYYGHLAMDSSWTGKIKHSHIFLNQAQQLRDVVLSERLRTLDTQMKPSNAKTKIIDDINSHISKMCVNELATLRNEIITTEVAIVNASSEIEVYPVSDVLAWAEAVDLSFTTEDTPTLPVTYWLDDTASEISFNSERDALISAFERCLKSNIDSQFSQLIKYLLSGPNWEITVKHTGNIQDNGLVPLDIFLSRRGSGNDHDVDIFLTNTPADAESYHSLKVSHDNELTWDHICEFFEDADFDDIDNLLHGVFDGVAPYWNEQPLYSVFFSSWRAERQKL